MEDTKRFVGPNGEFVSTYEKKDGEICIGYLEELLEWLYYHDNLENGEKLTHILTIENIIRDLLNRNMKINYIPTWSKKLEKIIKK